METILVLAAGPLFVLAGLRWLAPPLFARMVVREWPADEVGAPGAKPVSVKTPEPRLVKIGA